MWAWELQGQKVVKLSMPRTLPLVNFVFFGILTSFSQKGEYRMAKRHVFCSRFFHVFWCCFGQLHLWIQRVRLWRLSLFNLGMDAPKCSIILNLSLVSSAWMALNFGCSIWSTPVTPRGLWFSFMVAVTFAASASWLVLGQDGSGFWFEQSDLRETETYGDRRIGKFWWISGTGDEKVIPVHVLHLLEACQSFAKFLDQHFHWKGGRKKGHSHTALRKAMVGTCALRLLFLQELFAGSLHGLLCPMERLQWHNLLWLLCDYDVTRLPFCLVHQYIAGCKIVNLDTATQSRTAILSVNGHRRSLTTWWDDMNKQQCDDTMNHNWYINIYIIIIIHSLITYNV